MFNVNLYDYTEIKGFKGVQNFLVVAGLDMSFFEEPSLRIKEQRIENLNDQITVNFQEFWRQKIGKKNKIKIQFEVKNHPDTEKEKSGKPYLVFWIKDGNEKLFPKQRSQGVIWFLSFYLQLKASALKDDNRGRVLLIDEPGISLHARAQEDVLKVFEDIQNKIQVIYTTHSPHLVNLNTIYRLIAIQRAYEEDDKSETLVIDSHKLGAASSDTLSPVYTLMGCRFSDQHVIKQKNNVILEEISAFYYISTFFKLCKSKQEAHFLPATGTSNIPQLANLFLG